MSQEIDRATPTAHEHAAESSALTHDDEHGTRTVYTCACGAYRTIERMPRGSFLKSQWWHPEATRAG